MLPRTYLQLIALLQNVPSKINLIPFNPFPDSGYKRPNGLRIKAFQDRLMKAGFVTTIRTTRGDDIDAACGQLVGKVQDRTRRSAQWRAKVAAQGNNKIPVHQAGS